MSEDIDSFIKHQKAKLAAERDSLDNATSPRENNQVAPRMKPNTPEHTGLPIGGYEEKRRKLQQQRQKEYNEMISKTDQVGNIASRSKNYGNSLRFDSRSQLKKQLEEQRNREYNELMKQQQTPNEKKTIQPSKISPEQTSLRFDSGSQRRKHLQEERNDEYKQLLKDKQKQSSPWKQPVKSKSPEHLGLPLGQYVKVRKSLEEERKQEYKEYVEKTPKKEPLLPEISPEHTSLRFDSGSQRRRELSEERRKEYNKLLEHKQLSPTWKQTQTDGQPFTGLPVTDSEYQKYRAKLLEEKQRDYNFQKEASDLLTDHVSLPHIGLPLTGSHYQRRKDEMKAETNKEYNEFLKGEPQSAQCDSCPSPPHLGLDVGSYEDRRKLLEEQYQREYKEFVKKKLEIDDKTKPKAASIEHAGLPLGTHEVTRKSLEEERKAEYQDFVLKDSPREKKPPSTAAQHVSLPVTDSSYMNYRAQLNEIKQNEYKDYVEKPPGLEADKIKSAEHVGLPITGSSHQRRRARLQEQRNREYNEFLEKSPYIQPVPIPRYCGLTFTSYAQKYKELKRLKEERKREYNEYLLRRKFAPYQSKHCSIMPKYGSLPIADSNHQKIRARLLKEKMHEYNHYLTKLSASRLSHTPTTARQIAIPLFGTSHEKQQAVIELVRKKHQYTEKLRKEHKNRYSRHMTDTTKKAIAQPQMEFINKITN